MFLLDSPGKRSGPKSFIMETKIPKPSEAFLALMRADFTTQWRNRRAVIMSLLVPAMLLISWKGVIDKLGPTVALSMSLTIGLTSIGIMGYAISIARDRDKGIFQRLRATPVPNFFIMLSRLLVQLVMILLVTSFVFVVGFQYDGIKLTTAGYAITFVTATLGGALYLGLGQMIVGLVKNAETVNSTTRLVYIGFVVIGLFGGAGQFGEQVQQAVHWSPFGTVRTILSDGMNPSSWTTQTSIALLATGLYAVVFAFLGIKWFRWNGANK